MDTYARAIKEPRRRSEEESRDPCTATAGFSGSHPAASELGGTDEGSREDGRWRVDERDERKRREADKRGR
ncbi:hypothetical protein H9L39_00459 [Fusarium oxysporum f. sp. albedinis]|nr:hypothetical protein H9L39_00459 [Fusarium oxysporum f. sp. albedinis]